MLTDKLKQKRIINIGILVLFNVSIMASLRNLPLVAEYGLSSIVYFFIVALIFLLPCALVSAELATGWPKSGGIYIWVREAFGDTWGFFAIWMQWVHNVTWYPAILSFVATTLAEVIDPSLTKTSYYVPTMVILMFWGMTYINYLGIKTSTLFSAIGVVTGTILPGIFIILLGLYWFLSGEPLQTEVDLKAVIPNLSSINNLSFLAGLFLAFAGLEVSAGYASEVKDPQKNYPKAIIYAAFITFAIFLLGSLSIAIVIPKEKINLVSGLIDAFKIFLDNYSLGWSLPILAILLAFGAIGEVNSWIMGPVKALYTTSIHGNLPPFFQNLNKYGMPTHLLLFQAIIVTISTVVFLFTPSISTSYWILSALAAQMYLVMYIMMFLAAIKLRYSRPHVPRAYSIPSPHKGMWLIATTGLIACCFGIFISFLPPSQLDVGNVYYYETFLFIGLGTMVAIPLLIHQFRKPSWALPGSELDN